VTAFRVGSATHVGQVRSNNQDSWLVHDEQAVYAVADGMGGHQGGEVASAIAVETLEAIVSDATSESMVEAVKEANRRIISRATDTTELRGMGTTLVAIALVNRGSDDEEIAWVNVGDSRVYLLRDGDLVQLSRDHSLVEDLRRGGQLSDEEAAIHPQRNILTRALGIDREVEVDSDAVMPFLGDRFLLCSDGLFNEVDRDTIIATLVALDDPDAAAEELVRLANQGGGRDNITCVIVDVTDDNGRAAKAAELAAASAAAAEARRAAEDGDQPTPDEVEVDTVETVGSDAGVPHQADPVEAMVATAAPGALAEGVDDEVPTEDDPTPPDGTPLPPPPPPPAADVAAPAEPTTVDPADEATTEPGVEATTEPATVEEPAAFINPGFPTADGEEQAGSERFINPGFPTADAAPAADDDLPFGEPAVAYRDPDAGDRRHRGRILAGIGIVLVVVLAVLGGLTWYGGRGYFVTNDEQDLAIYEGKPGGFLWVEPSLVETSDVTLADASDAGRRSEVFDEPTFSSLDEARAYLDAIASEAEAAAEEDEPTTTTTEARTTTTDRSTTTTTGASTTGPGQQAQTPSTAPGP
jgi:serine/threonine protein phosphatase PrpC